MSSIIGNLKHKINLVLIIISKSIFRIIPKSNNSIVVTAWFGQRYADNTMYIYDYILKNHSELNICWLTRNSQIYQKLKSERKPVRMQNSIGGVYKQLRAKLFISTVQFSDYQPYWMTNCTLLDLGHGHPIKDPGVSVTSEESIKLMRYLQRGVRFCKISSSSFAKQIAINYFQISPNNAFVCGFARNDVFFDSTLRDGNNVIIDDIKKGRKAIVYMPTHRSSGHRRMDMSAILDLPAIQEMCEEHNVVFIIKKHYYHKNEIECLEKYPNIFDITNNVEIETQTLLYQADILISDYSACYVDYLLLNRPLVFYHYDIDDFEKEERSLIIPFSQIDIAPKPSCTSQLIDSLERFLLGEDSYSPKRTCFLQKYYCDNPLCNNNRAEIVSIIKSLL